MVNDNLNDKKPKFNIIYLRLFLVVLFTIIFYGISFGLSIIIFFMKYEAVENSWS